MLLVNASSQLYFILSFILTYLSHVILIIVIFCQSITNLAAASMTSVKAHKIYKS